MLIRENGMAWTPPGQKTAISQSRPREAHRRIRENAVGVDAATPNEPRFHNLGHLARRHLKLATAAKEHINW
jgi:hypothetical protein